MSLYEVYNDNVAELPLVLRYFGISEFFGRLCHVENVANLFLFPLLTLAKTFRVGTDMSAEPEISSNPLCDHTERKY